ncbi:MAG: DNA cytosine methyltransferase [Bryobacteraceae bacterium]
MGAAIVVAETGEQLARERKQEYTVAELFCGCGGLSHGFSRSGHFRVVFGNDIKKAALRTFVRNHSRKQAPPAVLERDIRNISIHQIEEALKQQGVEPGELDCLIGGPPCQGFSQMRRSEERLENGLVRFKGYNKLDQDSRNDLVLRFLEIAHALKPKIILIENVPQMLRHGHNGVLGGLAANVKSMLEEMGYVVVVGIINSADYGVPQLRERSFFLASRIGRIDLPQATHADPEAKELIARGLMPWKTVRDALSDLPAKAPAKETLGGGPIGQYPRVKLSDYARLMRSEKQFPFNHLTRSYSDRIIDIVRHMKPGETWDSASERMQRRYEKLIAKNIKKDTDRRAVKARLVKEGLINPVFYRHYYWSAYTRLAWDKPALTITANCNFLGSGRFTHPEQDRFLSPSFFIPVTLVNSGNRWRSASKLLPLTILSSSRNAITGSTRGSLFNRVTPVSIYAGFGFLARTTPTFHFYLRRPMESPAMNNSRPSIWPYWKAVVERLSFSIFTTMTSRTRWSWARLAAEKAFF